MSDRDGMTLWLTGLPSTGKSTIAADVADRLRRDGARVTVLDGDEIRAELTPDLGYSRADRDENVRRIGFVARLLAAQGVVVLAPVVAPFAAGRASVRAAHDRDGTSFYEAYVATPLAECARRDVKGLYADQRAGRLRGLTGVDDPYEVPAAPDLVVPAGAQRPGESAALVHEFVRARRDSRHAGTHRRRWPSSLRASRSSPA
ncbi:adenylylsulfate kinase [Cellulomonas flavigena DSM 20109]|uniref:Adenylyl-sulfate kinase n=1 Tax=Cellulomonas flavigena (strain ATCC 482 / DSM 20109 / BCRC 11376 / JCM 18109 / NBRC 3775 / NCIMB 8073 / NRS 134) TaxID=446466 RepID=D5UDM3_CELFN|nr:adenylyl-sulfate kinase [Cellulomonas flavigena]ADG76479.1 adenylylsulfate kinase [Cellulomonas flavigena DSM 20109]